MERKTIRDDEALRCLENRLSRIEGQVRGIKKMLHEDAYCTDILTQVAAIQAALTSFEKELLARHIRGCVVKDIKAGSDEAVDDLVVTLQKLLK